LTASVLVRLVAVVGSALGGAVLAAFIGVASLVGMGLGALAGALAVALEIALATVPIQGLAWTAIGASGGLLIGFTLGTALAPLAGAAAPAVRGALTLLGAWVGGVVAARRAPELPAWSRRPPAGDASVLDTSVIVDGRIADVAEAGFVVGTLLVPRMVVRELQMLADGSDPIRRNRGRRGFDVLERLRRNSAVRVVMDDGDVEAGGEVDAALVALARGRGARLLTNDTALGRVAALAGVATGSIHDLAGALRSSALPGETLGVQVSREGKEPGQGVAYLDDGTMVVIEGGKRHLGQALDVVVTSVLPTSAGRMIFARPRGEDPDGARDA
jgi:uncharacterized protein YacL